VHGARRERVQGGPLARVGEAESPQRDLDSIRTSHHPRVTHPRRGEARKRAHDLRVRRVLGAVVADQDLQQKPVLRDDSADRGDEPALPADACLVCTRR